ncbi:hypothetical protein AB6C74_05750 [Vibrio splendidus]
MLYIIACFLASIFGVLFGGILLGYISEALLVGRLETGDAATWLAAISTLGAAIGTIGSLIMLNRQHKQNAKHQERVWKKQEESLDFARYRDHKEQFEQLLRTLETKHDGFYAFKDKAKLYLDLFPNNSPRNEFSEYKYKLTMADLKETHPLSSAWKNIDKVDRILRTHGAGVFIKDAHGDRFEHSPNPLPIHQIEHTIFKTAGSLGLRCNRVPKTGDLINTDEVFANVFNPMVMRNHSSDIFESLNEFCGLESRRKKGVIYSPINIGFELLYYYRQDDTPHYNQINSGYYHVVDILFTLDRFIKLLHDSHPFAIFVRKSCTLNFDDQSLLKQIDDKARVRHYLNQVSIALRDIIENKDENSIEVSLRASEILNLMKEQASYEVSPL